MKEKNWLDYLDAVNDFSLSKGDENLPSRRTSESR